MSIITLPARRDPRANLLRYDMAGVATERTDTFSGATTVPLGGSGSSLDDKVRVVLANVGLAPGDVISASAEVAYDAADDQVRLRILYFDAAGVSTGIADTSDIATPADFTRLTISGRTIPAGTVQLSIGARVDSGTGTVRIRKGIVNRGAVAAPFVQPRRGAEAPTQPDFFGRENAQSAILSASGSTQITTFPSRLLSLRFTTKPMTGDELREWALVLDQLSDLENTFLYTPPTYKGPSTGYTGPNPLVNGASQLGKSLDVDGLDADTPILKAGDFVSFSVTSPKGNTNYQLLRIAADVLSNSSGEATLTFTTPIRQAPADDAVVQIYSPVAQFGLREARSGADIDVENYAPIVIDAIERVWP